MIFTDLAINRMIAGIPNGWDKKEDLKSSLKKYPTDRPRPQPGQ
jgi:hypothetical protein